MNLKTIFSCLFLLFVIAQTTQAQQKEETSKRKMTIVTKTIDENGKETITTVTKEGDEVSDEEIDKLIQQHLGEGQSLDVEVDVEDDKTEKITIKEKDGKKVTKKYKIIKKGQNIEIEGDGDEEVIWVEGDDKDQEEKDIMIIKKKSDGNEDILINEKDGHKKMIFITEDGEKHEIKDKDVKIIKKKKDGEEVEIKIDATDDEDMIWIEKEEGEDGDVIIIEEETTEEIDKDGKTIKKTVKKKKKIVKKEKGGN